MVEAFQSAYCVEEDESAHYLRDGMPAGSNLRHSPLEPFGHSAVFGLSPLLYNGLQMSIVKVVFFIAVGVR